MAFYWNYTKYNWLTKSTNIVTPDNIVTPRVYVKIFGKKRKEANTPNPWLLTILYPDNWTSHHCTLACFHSTSFYSPHIVINLEYLCCYCSLSHCSTYIIWAWEHFSTQLKYNHWSSHFSPNCSQQRVVIRQMHVGISLDYGWMDTTKLSHLEMQHTFKLHDTGMMAYKVSCMSFSYVFSWIMSQFSFNSTLTHWSDLSWYLFKVNFYKIKRMALHLSSWNVFLMLIWENIFC